MKDRLKSIATVLAISIVSCLQAQNRPITLQEAVDLSIKNSKQLKINRARMEEASAAVREAIQKKIA